MANIQILNDTFTVSGVNKYGDTVGTVQIDLGYGKIVTANAMPDSINRGLQVSGFIGRYVTSMKPWQATVIGTGSKLWVDFGRDDRSGRFNKAKAIRFDPDTYATLVNPDFWAAV